MSTQAHNDHDPYPSLGTLIEAGFADGERSWTERADIVELLAQTLEDAGIAFVLDGISFQLPDGWIAEPDIRGMQPADRGGVSITSVMTSRHPKIAPDGMFEYQHARGDTLQDAFRAGLKNWLELDYAVLADASLEQPQNCTMLRYSEPEQPEVRILLGPANHFARNPVPSDDPHPFCPCCLFTHSLDAFRELFQMDGLVGLRLFCMRDEQGNVSADCRVNGYDWAPGSEALSKYTSSWRDQGFEFRKQYVLVQRLAGTPGASG